MEITTEQTEQMIQLLENQVELLKSCELLLAYILAGVAIFFTFGAIKTFNKIIGAFLP